MLKGGEERRRILAAWRSRSVGLSTNQYFLLSDANDTLNKMAVFLCTHFIDQRIINPGRNLEKPVVYEVAIPVLKPFVLLLSLLFVCFSLLNFFSFTRLFISFCFRWFICSVLCN